MKQSTDACVMVNILHRKLIIYHKIKKIVKQTAQEYHRIFPMDLLGHLKSYQIELRLLCVEIWTT